MRRRLTRVACRGSACLPWPVCAYALICSRLLHLLGSRARKPALLVRTYPAPPCGRPAAPAWPTPPASSVPLAAPCRRRAGAQPPAGAVQQRCRLSDPLPPAAPSHGQVRNHLPVPHIKPEDYRLRVEGEGLRTVGRQGAGHLMVLGKGCRCMPPPLHAMWCRPHGLHARACRSLLRILRAAHQRHRPPLQVEPGLGARACHWRHIQRIPLGAR